MWKIGKCQMNSQFWALFSKKGQFHRIFCDQKMFQNSFVKSFDFQSSFKNRPLRFSFWFDQVARKLGNASLWIDASLKSSSTHSVKAKSNIMVTYFTTKTLFWKFHEMISRKIFMAFLISLFLRKKIVVT